MSNKSPESKQPAPTKKSSDRKVIATNREAHHSYHLEERWEAGLVLMGSEIKAIRQNKANLRDGFVQERDGELWLLNVHIAPYEQANRFNHEPRRERKLLLHRKEIARLITRVREKGYTIVPTQLYLKNGRAKVEIALARGKREFDKRDSVADREAQRQIQRVLKHGKYD